MTTNNGGAENAYEAPLEFSVARIGELEAAAEQARQAVVRQQSLALGVAVQALALHRNGLSEPGTNVEEIRFTAIHLLADLGLSTVVTIDREASIEPADMPSPIERRVAHYAALIGEVMRNRELSLRKVGRMSGVSHTHVGVVLRGAASFDMTYKVAASLGLVGEGESGQGSSSS